MEKTEWLRLINNETAYLVFSSEDGLVLEKANNESDKSLQSEGSENPVPL